MPEQLFINIAWCHMRPEGQTGLAILPVDQLDLAASPKRRAEQLGSRTWRRYIMATQLNVAPDRLCFAKDPYGKPYLTGYPQIQLSQSHSAQQLVLAFNQQGVPLGVDIESRQRHVNLALANRILTAQEMQAFGQAENPQAYLLKNWTIKEAVLKACGIGIRLNLNTLETEAQCDNINAGVNMAYHPVVGEWAYQCFENQDYYYTVAWKYTDQQQVHFNWLENNCVPSLIEQPIEL